LLKQSWAMRPANADDDREDAVGDQNDDAHDSDTSPRFRFL
jgi:hypothetical protein